MKSAAAKGRKLFRLAAAALLVALVLAPQIATADAAVYPETRLRVFDLSDQVGDQVDELLSRLSHLGYRHSYDKEVVGSLLVPRTGVQVVGDGPTMWTMPSGRVVADQGEYIWRMRHRQRSMARGRAGREAHTADEIRSAGFEPSNLRLTEGPRNFVPEAVEDLLGNPHFLEIKTSGYYSASFSNNIYPAVIQAGRRGVPFTLRIHSGVRLSRPLDRLIRKVQRRFGGQIVRVP